MSRKTPAPRQAARVRLSGATDEDDLVRRVERALVLSRELMRDATASPEELELVLADARTDKQLRQGLPDRRQKVRTPVLYQQAQ